MDSVKRWILFPQELDRLANLAQYAQVGDIVSRSRTSKYALNVRAHKETMINRILDGRDVQMAYLKIQNFKDVFNTFGAQLGVGHMLGDAGIFIVSKVLKEQLEKELASSGVTVDIGNAGAEYFVSFSNVGVTDVESILRNILEDPQSEFKKQVVLETKNALRDMIGADQYADVAQQLNEGFIPSRIHLYGGLTAVLPGKQAVAGFSSADWTQRAAQLTDDLYDQSFALAKHQQMQFSDLYETIRQEAKAKKGQVSENDLVNMFKVVVQDSAKVLQSGLVTYSLQTEQEIQENLKLGLLNEYQIFQLPIAPRYHSYTSIERLVQNYRDAVNNGADANTLREMNDRILETMLRYDSPNMTGDVVIYEGNEHFKRIINYILRENPSTDIDRTFRVGGDEYSKVVWNAATQQLSIYRFDGNNVGATNFEWGMRIGDKLIDESLRIISDTKDVSNLQNNVTAFFNNMGDRALTLSEDEVKSLQRKAPNFNMMNKAEYDSLNKAGTFEPANCG